MNSPFLEDFPETSNQDELELLMLKYPQYSAEYILSGSESKRKQLINSMWQLCSGFVENNFKKELSKNGCFTEKTWELVLGTFLRLGGYTPVRRTGAGPDFLIELDTKNIWIEATVPGVGMVDSAPKRPDLQPGIIYSEGGNIETTERSRLLRLLSAIRNKSAKESNTQYSKGVKQGLIKDDDCYVVAINGFEFLGISCMPDFLLRRSLFAAGCLSLRKDDNGDLSIRSYVYQPFVIKQTSDGKEEKIPSDIFLTSEYEEISAVIFTTEHVINSGTSKSDLWKKLWIVRNPKAKNPLPDTFPICGHEIIYNDGYITEINNVEE